jgi:hypothetical protein
MMTVDVSNGQLDITLTGWDTFWTLKREISVPLEHVKNVEVGPAPYMKWMVLRGAGSRWPGRIMAGHFHTNGVWSFWNVRKGKRVVMIDLEGEHFQRLVLEVGDPDTVAEMVKRAVK